jgi:methylated-DNA-[protein]-cysteine S-methyltransferase
MRTPNGQHYCLFDTDLGPCGVAWSEQGLTRLQLQEADRQATETRLRQRSGSLDAEAPPPSIARVVTSLQRYFAGEKVDFSTVALDLAGVGDFYRDIYAAARRVGWGKTATYGDLARQAGAPEAARVVGQAMARNPVAVIIPCHRILASGNKVGGFSAFGGTISKQRLLGLEGVRIGAARDVGQLSFSEQW